MFVLKRTMTTNQRLQFELDADGRYLFSGDTSGNVSNRHRRLSRTRLSLGRFLDAFSPLYKRVLDCWSVGQSVRQSVRHVRIEFLRNRISRRNLKKKKQHQNSETCSRTSRIAIKHLISELCQAWSLRRKKKSRGI